MLTLAWCPLDASSALPSLSTNLCKTFCCDVCVLFFCAYLWDVASVPYLIILLLLFIQFPFSLFFLSLSQIYALNLIAVLLSGMTLHIIMFFLSSFRKTLLNQHVCREFVGKQKYALWISSMKLLYIFRKMTKFHHWSTTLNLNVLIFLLIGIIFYNKFPCLWKYSSLLRI